MIRDRHKVLETNLIIHRCCCQLCLRINSMHMHTCRCTNMHMYSEPRTEKAGFGICENKGADQLLGKACVTSALRQPCTCPRRQISGFRAAASRCSILHRKTALQKNKVTRLPQRFFDMFIFFAICLRFLRGVQQPQDKQGCRKTAARHARCSYD